MRMFSEKYSVIPWFQIWTYDEVVDITKGFAEVSHPNSIAILRTARKGSFIEASVEPETTEVETTENKVIEEVPIEEQTSNHPLTFTLEEPSEEKGGVQNPVESPVGEVALTMEDVEAVVKKKSTRGPGKKSGLRRTVGRRK